MNPYGQDFRWNAAMMILFLRSLPRGLESLSMRHLNECALPYAEYLPPHLTNLSCDTWPPHQNPLVPLPPTLMDSLRTYSLNIPSEGDLPKLPPHLTSMSMDGSWERFWGPNRPTQLPPLTSLILRMSKWEARPINDEMIEALPGTLTTLQIDPQSTITANAPWPSNLTDLTIWVSQPLDTLTSFPRSLRRLTYRCWGYSQDAAAFGISLGQFDSLDTLTLVGAAGDTGEEFQHLPATLTSLTLEVQRLKATHFKWPPILRSLVVNTDWTIEKVQGLPNTLTSLVTGSMTDFAVQHLPLSMTHLQLQAVEITGALPSNIIASSPKEELIIPSTVFFDPLRFRMLPPGSLAADISVASQRQPFSSKVCKTMHSHLSLYQVSLTTSLHLTSIPDYVTSLDFRNVPYRPFDVFGSAEPMYDLISRLSNLKSLVLPSPANHIPLSLANLTKLERLIFLFDPSPATQKTLPPSLTYLELCQSREGWQEDLPVNLRFLKVPTITYSKLLPLKCLESLSIFQSMNEMSEVISSIPQTVTHLNLYEIHEDQLLPLVDRLPGLTQLDVKVHLNLALLEALVARGSKIELTVNSVHIERAEIILPHCDLKDLGSIPLSHTLHKGVCRYYPYLPKLDPDQVFGRFEESFWRTSAPFFSESLTTVNLGRCVVSDRFSCWLPRTITDLNLIQVLGTTHRTSAKLPPSLTRLAMPATGFNAQSYASLPRGITDLKFTGQRKFWPKHARALPPSLLTLTLDIELTSNQMIAELPRTLTKLDFGSSARSISGPAMKHLPPNLVWLGGLLPSVGDTIYVTTFMKIPGGKPWERGGINDVEIAKWRIQKMLENASLDDLASHLNLP
jgi:hypothetical protein